VADTVTPILSRYPEADRSALIPILQDIQSELQYISPQMVDQISGHTGVPAGEIFGVASFYAQFRFSKPGEHTVKVCLGTACHVRGSARILDALERQLGIRAGQVSADGRFGLEDVACFGCCALAPVVMVDNDVHGRMSSTKARKLVSQYDKAES
jgi:NADH-quinone oxidoreductase subunit E